MEQNSTDQTGLRRRIENYRPFGAQEERERQTMLSYMDRFSDLPKRSNETAHFTASALILNERRDRTLLVYHNLYDSWSWTGGHADGETDLLAVALREAQEETGAEVRPISPEILSLDILPVWGHVKRGVYVASHLHLNLAFLLEADENAPLRVKPDENSGVRWFPLEDLTEVVREREMKPVYRKLISRAEAFSGGINR